MTAGYRAVILDPTDWHSHVVATNNALAQSLAEK